MMSSISQQKGIKFLYTDTKEKLQFCKLCKYKRNSLQTNTKEKLPVSETAHSSCIKYKKSTASQQEKSFLSLNDNTLIKYKTSLLFKHILNKKNMETRQNAIISQDLLNLASAEHHHRVWDNINVNIDLNRCFKYINSFEISNKLNYTIG